MDVLNKDNVISLLNLCKIITLTKYEKRVELINALLDDIINGILVVETKEFNDQEDIELIKDFYHYIYCSAKITDWDKKIDILGSGEIKLFLLKGEFGVYDGSEYHFAKLDDLIFALCKFSENLYQNELEEKIVFDEKSAMYGLKGICPNVSKNQRVIYSLIRSKIVSCKKIMRDVYLVEYLNGDKNYLVNGKIEEHDMQLIAACYKLGFSTIFNKKILNYFCWEKYSEGKQKRMEIKLDDGVIILCHPADYLDYQLRDLKKEMDINNTNVVEKLNERIASSKYRRLCIENVITFANGVLLFTLNGSNILCDLKREDPFIELHNSKAIEIILNGKTLLLMHDKAKGYLTTDERYIIYDTLTKRYIDFHSERVIVIDDKFIIGNKFFGNNFFYDIASGFILTNLASDEFHESFSNISPYHTDSYYTVVSPGSKEYGRYLFYLDCNTRKSMVYDILTKKNYEQDFFELGNGLYLKHNCGQCEIFDKTGRILNESIKFIRKMTLEDFEDLEIKVGGGDEDFKTLFDKDYRFYLINGNVYSSIIKNDKNELKKLPICCVEDKARQYRK